MATVSSSFARVSACREFRAAVDRLLGTRAAAADAEYLRQRLTEWQRSVSEVVPILRSNVLLTEDIEVANAIDELCSMGLEALDILVAGTAADASVVQSRLAMVDRDSQPKAEMLIQFAPGISKLVQATLQSR